VIIIPGFFEADVFKNMGALYAVGSLLSFMFAHASIISLRIRRPSMPRPFKLGVNIKIKGRELPVSAILGICALGVIWIIILITQPYSRWVGLGWMVIGIIVYYFYRKRENLPLTHAPENRGNNGKDDTIL
jgi:APA family basic amino acid/polyamine antiporter